MSLFAVRPGSLLGCLVTAAFVAGLTLAGAEERGFPYDRELMLDINPMKGFKRVPILEIGSNGEASIDLWCNSLKAQLVVPNGTITVLAGSKTERHCGADRMHADDELLTLLLQVTKLAARRRFADAARYHAIPLGYALS
jgi:META domain